MNPYASWLDGRDPLAIIQETSSLVKAAVDAHQAAGTIDRPRAAGKWSLRQVLAHLADTEIVFAMRLRQSIAEDDHIIQPFDQDAWARGYAEAGVETALAVFTTVRAWNVQFIRAQPEAAFARSLSHPERGTMTFRTLVETMAGHDRNHLSQMALTSSAQTPA
ncbi:MAG: DinB family protein [Acidobacteria bacterium]|nr:DinB family protein [Acidobacteriota bacterium]